MRTRPSSITQKQVAAFLKPRPRDSHKHQFGTVVVIGGASGMVGAALLAGRAALKLGAGCVHVGMLADNAPVVDLLQPELMLHSAHDALRLLPLPQPLPHGERGAEPFSHPGKGWEGGNVLAIGCGMGTSVAAQKILHDILERNIALVLDADALNLLACHNDLQDDLHARKAPTIITPHPGEAARLLGYSTTEVQAARTQSAQQLAEKLHCSVVLKGAGSVCVTRNGKTYINKTGNPGMSAPGMGDVLTGMIATFIAQGLGADDALLLAVHLHGAAGDALEEKGITIGMTATEVMEWARLLLNQLNATRQPKQPCGTFDTTNGN
ncbi:MAG: NAD(P)H-hydrate dehydratase [Gallionellaceae bacterium]|nr:NAD(P)H-hydrate dehydratase [Gallionellaceae bacterium]